MQLMHQSNDRAKFDFWKAIIQAFTEEVTFSWDLRNMKEQRPKEEAEKNDT